MTAAATGSMEPRGTGWNRWRVRFFEDFAPIEKSRLSAAWMWRGLHCRGL